MKALYCEQLKPDLVKCLLCPHHCRIPAGKTGFCGIRENEGGVLQARSYGQISSLSLDPIEKKPLYHFYPGSKILSLGSYGCNFRCGFCQNHSISLDSPVSTEFISPEKMAATALALVKDGNIGLAFTYNEPFIAYEYLLDCAKHIHKNALKNVVVTNGYINKEPLLEVLPFIDAMNIDLKSFKQHFYAKVGGKLEAVKETIQLALQYCHVEVTTLIIPGENDSIEEMDGLSSWLGLLNPEIPLHISRFFPRYKMTRCQCTPIETIDTLCRTAKKNLRYVYGGNVVKGL